MVGRTAIATHKHLNNEDIQRHEDPTQRCGLPNSSYSVFVNKNT
jgi:hypothetical protein